MTFTHTATLTARNGWYVDTDATFDAETGAFVSAPFFDSRISRSEAVRFFGEPRVTIAEGHAMDAYWQAQDAAGDAMDRQRDSWEAKQGAE